MGTYDAPISPVLVVEDSEDIRTLLELLLAGEGIPVVTARNGKEGIEKLRALPNISLVLLDIMMPVMNGEEFLAPMPFA